LKILEVIQKVKDVSHCKRNSCRNRQLFGDAKDVLADLSLYSFFVAVGALHFPLTRCLALGIENLLVEFWFLIS